MKRLTLLAFLSTPAFAHQTTFDQPDFLKMSNGDPIAAQELSWFCSANGKSIQDCKDSLSGNGNLKQEAARKCVRDSIAAAPIIKGFDNKEIPGSRAHQAFGKDWHKDYQTDTDGVHRHAYSENDRQRAVAQYKDQLIQAKLREKEAAYGSTEKTTGQGVNGGLEIGIPGVASTTVGADGTITITKINAKLTPSELAAIDAQSKNAHNNPSIAGIEPSIVCVKSEKNCRTPDGTAVKNDSYEPSKDEKKDADKGKKSDDKKGANNNPPKHENETTHDIPDNTSTAGGDSWVGNDTARNPDDPMIANPASEDLAAKSPIESCLDKEFNKLIQDEGSKTKDPNAEEAQNFRKEKSENLLKAGYCDESYYGKSYCQAHKNRQASVVPITIIQERKEAAESAIKSFHNTGICNPNVLGREFCKAQVDKWTTTPAEKLEIVKPIKPGSPPTRPFSGN